jgi:hypothetical protein
MTRLWYNINTGRKTCPCATLSTTNTMWNGICMGLGLLSDKLENKEKVGTSPCTFYIKHIPLLLE